MVRVTQGPLLHRVCLRDALARRWHQPSNHCNHNDDDEDDHKFEKSTWPTPQFNLIASIPFIDEIWWTHVVGEGNPPNRLLILMTDRGDGVTMMAVDYVYVMGHTDIWRMRTKDIANLYPASLKTPFKGLASSWT
ncbi:hypothetical protein RRG08_004308 [Elysia crispata]|uniref:Uncharacterized protein n=1 Tax=Elysia crispata TaxID=231223 RepID=A0AAE0YBX8_9GAST|nr:hypothetical protein RRG08_004308 [Elysia crispata]